MKIKEISKSVTYYVTTDEPDFPDYRTDENGTHWENAMGESWEAVYNDDKLRTMFLDYFNSNGNNS